jgi:hypothetical protein
MHVDQATPELGGSPLGWSNQDKVRQDWQRPSVPHGFDTVCAFNVGHGRVELDYVNLEQRDFASKTMDVSLDWPWVQGFRPTGSDWELLGFAYFN